jgi:rsbT co-antagonist protein RsbR
MLTSFNTADPRVFQAMVELAPDAIICVVNQKITYKNPAAQALFGYSDAEWQTKTIVDLYTEMDQINNVAEHLEQHTSWSGELNYQRANGSSFIGQASIFVLESATPNEPVTSVAIIRDVTKQHAQRQQVRTFEALVEKSPDAISIVSPEQGVFTYTNAAFKQMFGYGDEILQQPVTTIYLEENYHYFPELMEKLMTEGKIQGTMEFRRKNGSVVPTNYAIFVVRDKHGKPESLISILRDMTDQHLAEQERTAFQQQIIETQQVALRELSTPLIPIADGVVLLPLIGTIDTSRAQQVLETLLEGISRQQAEIAILDITGVRVVDTQVANALLRSAQAAQLLGATVVLSGISAEVAQTLVGLGIDLSSIHTRSTLQSGIAEALSRAATLA